MGIRILIFSVIVLALDLYFFQALRTLTENLSVTKKVLIIASYWIVSVSALVFMLSFREIPEDGIWKAFKLYGISMVMIVMISKVLGILPLIIDDIIRLGNFVANFFAHGGDTNLATQGMTRGKFLSKMAIIVAAVPMATFIYGMVKGAFDYQVRKTKLKLQGLPKGFEGLKIVQISDLHLGSYVSPTPLARAVEIILEQKADLIFFTGDLVNNKASEAEPFIDTLKAIVAPMGVYSILGNHDYGDYVEWPSLEAKEGNLQRLIDIQGEIGWKVLLNENVVLEKGGDKLAILGVENWGAMMRFPKYGDLSKAYQGTEDVKTKLLLSHDPSHWRGQVTREYKDIDCTFSGHTHGMQFGIEIPGFKWSPVQYVYKQWAGLYKHGNQQIYVNRGLGCLGYMGRVGILPEISVFELESA
jgi:hypothetical protein